MVPPKRAVAGGLALALLAAPAVQSPAQTKDAGSRGQARQAPASLPAVRSELVQLDVVVGGKDGRLLDDLAAGDFQVYEDGKPQPLAHFSVARRPGREAAPAAPVA